ncbi:related to heterokaryon incompatibility protein [Cephalotrichum gorgonifer]|uniref:Related to heterokaryon incompatibility protein n=1 Tax=Cephalotrichum gorgonifer TaxID=2041049 RepID=A0AAE8N4B2_9PEZI|nr:related to heterokaryon incompatibility protein [Cephalotrichum gorgonifer]
MAPYQYSPLLDPSADIRLLTLLPGKPDDDICLTISHEPLRRPGTEPLNQRMTLDDVRKTLPSNWDVDETLDGRYLFEQSDTTFWTHPDPDVPPSSYQLPPEVSHPGFQPQYEALSYTWGTSDDPETAFIQASDDNTSHSTLQITQNLAAALRHFRHGQEARRLWVDAVCINQNDIPERDSQVLRMADIYQLAHRVVVWLGPESGDSKLALDTLGHLGSQAVASKRSTLYSSPEANHSDWFRSRKTLPFDDRAWVAIHNLVKRSWFDRLWVIQEIHLANPTAILQCGFDTVPWMQLRVALICLSNKVQLPSRELFNRVRYQQSFARNLRPVGMPDLLLLSQINLCANPRDKIYGILGLAPKKIAARIRPQYSLPTAEVYKDAFLVIVDEMKSLTGLLSCNLAGRQTPNLPSWVPDWSVPDPPSTVNESFASGRSHPHISFRVPDVLEVAGIHVTTVREVKGPAPRTELEVLSSIRNWAPPNMTEGKYPNGESLIDAFAATVISDLLRERFPRFGPAPTAAEWKATLLAILSDDQNVNTRLLGYMTGRAFITTDTGHFGLGIECAKPGDRICAILGCKDLLILRPNNQQTYEVVGPCSIRGFCDAEAVLGPLPSPWAAVIHRPNVGGAFHFQNRETGESTHVDPRLEPLPVEWQEIRPEGKEDDVNVASRFRNKDTGEVMESDPRMLPDALRDRGIPLENFCLV